MIIIFISVLGGNALRPVPHFPSLVHFAISCTTLPLFLLLHFAPSFPPLFSSILLYPLALFPFHTLAPFLTPPYRFLILKSSVLPSLPYATAFTLSSLYNVTFSYHPLPCYFSLLSFLSLSLPYSSLRYCFPLPFLTLPLASICNQPVCVFIYMCICVFASVYASLFLRQLSS